MVYRKAILPFVEIEVDANDGNIAEQLYARFHPRRHRIDIREAPLLRVYVAHDKENDCCVMTLLQHHLLDDNTSLREMQKEIKAHLLGRANHLPMPLPFRNLVAQARLGLKQEEHQAFFRLLLGDVNEPTAPFGMLDVQGDGTGILQSWIGLDKGLADRIRQSARRLKVSAASLFHLAWARLLALVSGRDDIVFGTVLFGRMQSGEGADRAVGPYINTLPIRIPIGQEGIESSVRRTHILLADLMHHEHASLAVAQRCSGVPPSLPLFSALLNYRHSLGISQTHEVEDSQALEGIRWLLGEERTNYPFTLSVNDLGEDFRLTAQTPASIDPLRICEFMRTTLQSLTEALETSPAKALRSLEVLPAFERHRLLYEWNDTRTEFPHDQCVQQLFEQQVEKTPDATAVVFQDQELSYVELNRRANQLAHHLRDLGVRPDHRVAICVERSLEMIVALLAVLKAGGAYVPLDPSYPLERLHFMLQDSAPVALLTQHHLSNLFSDLSSTLPVLDLNAESSPWQQQPETNLDPDSIGLTPQHLAYVIYTSGSTGIPKGVLVEHLGLVNRLVWMQYAQGLTSREVVLQKTPFGFDVSVWELFLPLIAGARLVMAQPEGHKDPAYLCEVIQQNQVTIIHFVPSMLQTFLEHEGVVKLSTLVHLVCSGEALSAALLRRFQERLPHTVLHNLYGPTEAVVDVTAWSCPDVFDQSIVPIGRPIANTQIYILDVHGEPVPVGVTGELYIGGVQVARGYLNRPELTAERFLVDPFSTTPAARMYRTGDLGRYLPDGNIEFLGRNDFQVKIRGFRIELGEIETRLAEHSAVRDAVVIAREDTPGDKRLVAYYTVADTDSVTEISLGAEALRSHLSAVLPEYMVPAAYVRLQTLPLTLSGKLDRKALPAPDGDAYAVHGYEPPQGDIEIKLAAIWADVLKLDRVGRHDNFFELGGHSLLAVTLIGRMRLASLQVNVRDIFATPTLAGLATATGGPAWLIEVPLNRIPARCEAITPEMLPLVHLTPQEIEQIIKTVPGGAANIQDIYPLTPLQEGILFHHLLAKEGDPYILSSQVCFDTRARMECYIAALQAVIERHDILRSAVHMGRTRRASTSGLSQSDFTLRRNRG